MVVIAIVAILGAFALPVVASTPWQTPFGAHTYQDYTIRTLQAPPTGSYATRRRVAETISWSEGIRKQIADNAFNGVPLLSGLQSTTTGTPKYLKSISITPSNGTIYLTFTGSPAIEGTYLYLVPKAKPNASTPPQLLSSDSYSTTIPYGQIYSLVVSQANDQGKPPFGSVHFVADRLRGTTTRHRTCRSDEAGVTGVTTRGTLPGKYAPPYCTEKIML